jgi:hypothetical protein
MPESLFSIVAILWYYFASGSKRKFLEIVHDSIYALFSLYMQKYGRQFV